MCVNLSAFLYVAVLIFFVFEFVIYILYTRQRSYSGKVSGYVIFAVFAFVIALVILLRENTVLLLLLPWFATGTTQIVFDLVYPSRSLQKENASADIHRFNALWFGIKLGLYLVIFFLVFKNYEAGYIAIMTDYFISYVFVLYVMRENADKIEYDTVSIFLTHVLVFLWVLVFAFTIAYAFAKV